MLIDTAVVRRWLDSYGISVKGVFHIGAHECEELEFYKQLGLSSENVVWIEAIPYKVAEMKTKGIPNVFQAVVTDKDNDTVTFHVSNNGQSSSVLPFGTHSIHHSWVHYVGDLTLQTTTIDTFVAKNNLDASQFTFWNLDIQGAELMALRGATESLRWPLAIYLEVNVDDVYVGCGKLHEIETLLGAIGFVRVETKMTNAGWGDALFLRKP
jgi:FkbM family methyltransferase